LKVLVIGLDGGDLRVFRRMTAAGHMPFLSSVLRGGTSGELQSIFPPTTPPAWSTFMTGKNPGKHGIFDFFIYTNSGTPTRVVNSSELKAETLWSMLGRAGKRVGVVNVPMTYPPRPVNGTMITDLLTPGTRKTFTYPAGLYKELKPHLGKYVISIPWREYPRHRARSFLEDLVECSRRRRDYALHLMERDPWDFFMVVFSETDFLQHAVWSYLDPEDSRDADDGIEHLIIDFFGTLDGHIRKLCTSAGEDARVFFVSDHGFGKLLNYFHVNTWLMNQGWLSLKPWRLFTTRAVWKLRKALRRKVGHQMNILPLVRWERTRAFCVSAGEQGVRINLRGREPGGTVSPGREYEEVREEIITALGEARVPETGENIVDAVFRREDVYTGPHAGRGADILFICRGGRSLADVFPARVLMEATDWESGTGTHRLQGMFAAMGPGIRRDGTVKEAHLQDCVPTILYAMQQPIPSDVDGRVLSEIFEPEVLSACQPRFTEPVEWGEGDRPQGYTEEDERQVCDRLRGLGYLD